MINKVLAGVITVGFLHVVRPDATAARWGIALVSVLMFEGIRWSIDYVQKVNRRKEKERYITLNLQYGKEDGRRLEDEVFNPLKVIS